MLTVSFKRLFHGRCIVQNVEFGSVQPRSAGENVTQTVQNGFDRGLIGQGAGGIQQSSISRFCAPHVLRALLSHLWNVGRIIRSTLHETHSPSYFSSRTWCTQTEVPPHAAAFSLVLTFFTSTW